MDAELGFATLAARLASFETTIPVTAKNRQSNAKGSKTISWPHQNPTPGELAQAGFYYKPSSSNPDNTVCFLCDRALDGWEEDDDPVAEHIKHSTDCAWAMLMGIAQESHDASTMEDPTHRSVADARRTTFACGWPHESKRGWTCKIEKMVEAGWYFAPTPESEDFVSCAYCKLSLDGWEPKDNPFQEHHRRSPECPFFAFAGGVAPKTTRGKKGRASKGGRLSTQSAPRVASQAQSIPDLDESIDTSSISIMSGMSAVGKKKSNRGKKATTAIVELSAIVDKDQEPSVMEIPPPVIPAKATRGKKRTSDQISEDDHGRRESTVKPEPAAKRRNTRTRNSVMRDIDNISLLSESGTVDVENAPNKATRGGRKRASSISRGTSKSKLPAQLEETVPDNTTIEAALEADLERPLSDEEEPADLKSEKPKRGRQKKAAAAPEPPSQHLDAPEVAEDPKEKEMAEADESEAEIKPKGHKSRGTSKAASKKTKAARGSLRSSTTVETHVERQADSSALAAHTFHDDSGHETDASVASKSVVRKLSKKKAATKVRGKTTAKRITSKTFEAPIEPQPENTVAAALTAATERGLSLAAATEAGEMEIDQKIAELTKEIEEEDVPPKKATRGGKGGKGKASKAKGQKKDKIPQLSMPGAFSPLAIDSVEPSFASALSSATPPVKATAKADWREPLSVEDDMDMEIRSPEVQSTPTPRRVAAPPLPPRSSARPTPTAMGSPNRSAILRPTPTPSKRTALENMALSPHRSPSVEQSSDAENAPPSSLPEKNRPPLQPLSPVKRVVLQHGTPTTTRRIVGVASPSKITGGLKSEVPWTAVDVEMVFGDKENRVTTDQPLTSPEKNMTVEEWIYEKARKAEEDLRREGERVVGVFETEGQRAMRVLEGIECS